MSVRKPFCGIFIAIFSLLCLLAPSVAFAVDDEVTRASLRGLDGIRVVMEYLRPEIIRDGLNGDQIQDEVQLQLQGAGIKVLGDERLPFLLICPYITKFGKNNYCYFVRMEFYQLVVPYQFLSQKTEKESASPVESALFATTWTSPGVIGTTANLADIKGRISDEVAKFITAFKAANPR
jgi:hypothetical protein